MAVNFGDKVYSVVILTDEGATNLRSSHLSNISYVQVPRVMKSKMCFSSKPNLQNFHTSPKVDKVNNNARILDISLEKEKAEVPQTTEDSASNLKADDSVAACLYRVLQRDIGLQLGGRFMQFLMNHGTELPKFTSRGPSLQQILDDSCTEVNTNSSDFWVLVEALKCFLSCC